MGNTSSKQGNTSSKHGNTSARATMEDLVKTAELYYEKSSLDIKAAAWNFFDSLDYNNDAKVSLQEFLGFMRDKGHVKMGSSQFFKELDNDNNGTLEFMEVMALYYIIKSGRPFCGGCDEFIPGMYFTCSVCFDNGNDLFCVCSNCFQRDNYRHDHSQFLDNYALLEAKRMQGIATCSNQHKPSSSVTITELEYLSTTNAVGPYQPKPQWGHLGFRAVEVALNALDFALNAAKIFCTSNVCTIM